GPNGGWLEAQALKDVTTIDKQKLWRAKRCGESACSPAHFAETDLIEDVAVIEFGVLQQGRLQRRDQTALGQIADHAAGEDDDVAGKTAADGDFGGGHVMDGQLLLRAAAPL